MYQYVLSAIILLICSYTDIKYRRVSKGIAAIYFTLAVLGHLAAGDSPGETVLGLIPGGFCFLLSWISRQGLGYGDSVLITGCGVSLGFGPCMLVSFTAFFWAGLWAMGLFVFRKADRKKELPFVPFLLLGVVIQGIGGG